ncbi:MAG: guanylate kinase [Thermodesulfobacteriota bacterium]|nr:guanylate kinase [Thermodesulfobacteriota bacterium]
MAQRYEDINGNQTAATEKQRRHGRLFIVSAPSGAGKTTLCNAIVNRFPDMIESVSHTTRPPREGETHGTDYFFIDKDTFENGIDNNRWLEWAQVHGNYYGTAADFIETNLARGVNVLLNIDVQGARQIFDRYRDSIGIFIMPPSMAELRRRLESRGKDSPEAIERRLKTASVEMSQKHHYHHVVLNDNLETAINDLSDIIQQYC